MYRVVQVIVSRLEAGCVLACAAVAFGFGCWAAQASAYVYWSNGDTSSIGRANLNGTGAGDSYITGALHASGVAVNSQYIYWANGAVGTIGRANLDGTGTPDQTLITGTRGPEGVAVAGQYIYWANRSTSTIGRANLNGGDADQRFITGANAPEGVAVNGQYIYWANTRAGTIGRQNLDGTGTPDQTFITGAHHPIGVAVNSQHIYWTNTRTGTIGQANLDGTDTSQSFITGANQPYGIAVDGQYIYWTNYGTHTIERANLNGTGTPERRFITRVVGPDWVAVTTRVPRWTLELTAVPASAAIGTPATLTAVTNNILNGTPLYHINISAGGTVFKRCKKNTCTVSLAAGEGLTTYEADVSAVHSKKAVVSAAADVDRTRPTCTGNECM